MAETTPSPGNQSPISKLPDELLSLILETAVEDYECYAMPSEPLSWFLLSITRVSKHWRHVSNDSPRLWKNICQSNLQADGLESSRVGVQYYPSSICLARSLAAPLNVYVVGDPESAKELFRALEKLETTKRVRHMFLDRAWSLATAVDTNMVFPNLESLGATLAQNRRSLFADFLTNCPNITRFHLDCAAPPSVDPSLGFTRVVALNKLTSLRLLWARATTVQRLLSVISVPSLVELTATFRFVPYHPTDISLENPQVLSGLRVLTIGGRCTSENIIGLLRYTPRLCDLRFHTILHGDLEDLLDVVQSRADLEGVTLPDLRTLSIHACRISLHGVLRFLDSRIGGFVRILGLSRPMIQTYPTSELEGIAYRVQVDEWYPPGLHYSPRQLRDELVPLVLELS